MTAGLVEPDVVVAAPVCADVTAVLVTAGVTPYLVEALDAVAAQTRPPAVVLLVDVGGPRGAAELLDTTFADVPGVRTARTAVTAPAFGAAVAAGLAKLSTRTTWLWLLHDDCAPRPTALAELVDAAGQGTSVALAGPKQRTWTDPERLIEVGLTTTRGGRRVTAAVRGELDQGQHDATTDVLAVGTVAALVRQDVWQQVGTDPALGPFGDGLDLSRRVRLAGHRVVVVPRAVVRHAQASYLGLRPPVVELDRPDAQPLGAGPAGDPGRSLAARRRSAVHTQLVRAVWWAVPFVALAALVAAPVRALARLVAGEPALAGRELGGWAALARPHAIWRGRRGVARASVLPRRALWPLQATWRQVWAGASERRASRAGPARPRRSDLEAGELARLARRRRGGLALLLLALCAVSAAAWADLGARVLAGARLVGGALAFAPTTWDQAWTAATSGWVGEGLGSEGPADPLARVLAVGAAPVGGDVGVVVAVVLGAAAVAAGWGAWVAAGAATRSVPWRVWAALVWALAPGLLTATSTGRVGAVIAHVLLPW
ncbi:MAG: glycosyltransferase, partial [Micrococcales bacterium]|nr:glycosyltransferase [Micrococcales bacterium]